MSSVTLYFVLYLIAVILFALSALQVSVAKISLGLAFAFAVPLIQTLQKL